MLPTTVTIDRYLISLFFLDEYKSDFVERGLKTERHKMSILALSSYSRYTDRGNIPEHLRCRQRFSARGKQHFLPPHVLSLRNHTLIYL